MRGRCERVVVATCVAALLGLPAIAESRKQHPTGASTTGASATGAGGAKAAAGAPAGTPPNQMDFFQGLSLGSNKEPIHINSDALELDYKGSVLTYSGNVKVTQGDVTLTSDRLAITYDRQAVQRSPATSVTPRAATVASAATQGGAAPSPAASPGTLGGGADKIKEVIAEGHVRIQRGDRIAEGRRAVFDQAKQTITLSDGAVLHEGANQVAGERIIVYLQEQRSVVESGSNSRVSAVFYPNANASGGTTPAPTPRAAGASPAAIAASASPSASHVQVGESARAAAEGH